eukprot:TRINITY_DN1856_c0_g1_i1.p1 TRINITY_DN1856_c0_g1~~TRINITY_DN1856_c0_g1_i1.p1  ORF type:complete len:100 (+),score=25.74 TRINITY_DN1856_c0_g1_i1:530-829(+)
MSAPPKKKRFQFRNYHPKDEKLKPMAPKPTVMPKKIVKEMFEREEIDYKEKVYNLAPKDPLFDLKRDVAKQLAILEKRTEERIQEHVEGLVDAFNVRNE